MRVTGSWALAVLIAISPALANQEENHDHAMLRRKYSSVRERLATETPVAMRKMSGDPGEMFLPEYWIFDSQDLESRDASLFDVSPGHNKRGHWQMRRRPALAEYGNTTLLEEPLPPFLMHSDTPQDSWTGLRNLPRRILNSKRDFQCPTNTTACTSINRPNSCCATDETCVIVTDSGNGDVGCCPRGSSCGSSVGNCDTTHGYQSCPGSSNGGCCIPGYGCNGIGCAAGGTSTSVTVVLTTVSVTSGTSSASSTTTAPVPSSTASVQISTSTVFVTLPPSVATTTVSANSSSPTTSTTDAPTSSMSMTTTTITSSPDAAGPPVRPTSGSSSSEGMCPMGFYACSAYEIGGCCQTGRNCDTTSCPSSTTQTVVSSGLTILVPGAGPVSTEGVSNSGSEISTSTSQQATAEATTSTAKASGQCPTGWSLCAASQGGGCCPSGYGCAASCTATAGASPGSVAKASPDSRGARAADRFGPLVVGAVAVGVGGAMLVL